MAKSLLVLTSQVTLNREQFQNQQRAMTVLLANHIPYETIDGADPVYKDRRNELFRMSGIRGNYPQFFLVEMDGSVSFLGDWNAIEEMNDASGLPEEILEANPGIPTWKTVLG